MSEQALPAVDLSNCDREPIHIPGSIQPHGVLLGLRPDELRVVLFAGDTERLLGHSAEELAALPLEKLFANAHWDLIRQSASTGNLPGQHHFLFRLVAAASGVEFDAQIHHSDRLLVVELEPRQREGQAAQGDALVLLKNALANMRGTTGLGEFSHSAARLIQDATGFDRVMIYRFLADGSGTVIAESLHEGLEPYLGLHYPASDIPRQARALYLRNWIRLIADVDYRPLPVVPSRNPVTGRPFDMSYCSLRSVSPIHVEYLKNMGVGASMSISLIHAGELWGLIACHHATPRSWTHNA